MTTANDHGLARDCGSHLIGTEWRHPWNPVRWRVTQAMYGILRLDSVSTWRPYQLYEDEDYLCREMVRVEEKT